MLALDRPSPIADGLFEDDTRPGLLHALPDALAVAMDGIGRPELSLVLHSAGTDGEGGLFQARFRAGRADAAALNGLRWKTASIVSARMKLTPRTPVAGAEALSLWRDVILDGEGGLVASFFLSARDADLMRELVLGGSNSLDLDVDLTHSGVRGGYPFEARANAGALSAQLQALLGSGDNDGARIEAAFLSLGEGVLRFQRTGPGPHPGLETLIRETARRALETHFDRASAGLNPAHILRDADEAEEAAWRLDRPRPDLQTIRLRWSFQDFVRGLEQAEIFTHFPVSHAIRPLEEVAIRALNQIPLDPAHVTRARLDLSYTDRGGTQTSDTIEFRPGDPIVKSLKTVFPALTHAFKVESRLRLLIAPPTGAGFPLLWPRDAEFVPSPDPLSIDMTPDRADIAMINLQALDGVFDYCGAVRARIEFGGGTVVSTITAEKPQAWVALPGHARDTAFSVKLEAFEKGPDTEAGFLLRDKMQTDTHLLVTPIDLMVRAPDRVTGRIVGNTLRFAVVDLRRPGSDRLTTRAVRPGEPADFALWRDSVFAPLAYEWRMSAVRQDEDGRTRPMETGEWAPSTERVLTLS